MTFAFFDGDGIGDTLEILLIENRINEAVRFSQNIKNAMELIEHIIQQEEKVNLLICGGDDIFIEYPKTYNATHLYKQITETFKSKTRHSMSCGAGNTPVEATRNLYLAKLYGKDQLVGEL